MKQTIGIDLVEIERFAHWHTLPTGSLTRIFSDEEIAYCTGTNNSACRAARFAVRYAAREAFFKAIALTDFSLRLPFLSVCKLVRVERTVAGVPFLTIDWEHIIADSNSTGQPMVSLSLTHTRNSAAAVCLISWQSTEYKN